MKNRQEISRLGVIGEEQGLEKEYFLFSNPRKNLVFLPERTGKNTKNKVC